MVASDASKGELSEAMDSMIEEVRLKSHVQFLCFLVFFSEHCKLLQDHSLCLNEGTSE